MKKWLVRLLIVLLSMTVACAENADVTWGECCLGLPEGADAPVVTWTDGAGEPRMLVLTVPPEQREAVLAAMEAAPEWMLDADYDREDALKTLRYMRCTELPELPEDMVFEAVCFWAEELDAAGTDEDRLFAMVMTIGLLALDDTVVIDLPLRLGFYDVDSGTLLMAGWME